MRVKTVLLAATLAVLTACSTDKKEETKVLSANTVDATKLTASFSEAWNKKDSAAVVNFIADDALLISGRGKMTGRKEIADRWVHRNLPVAGNLKIEDLQTETGGDIACITGTWSVEVTVPGNPATTSSGNHTFVWKKQADSAWKLVLLNMEDHDPAEAK